MTGSMAKGPFIPSSRKPTIQADPIELFFSATGKTAKYL